MKKQTKRSFLAFLLAVCMILSPLGTTAVRAAAPAEEEKTEKEQVTEEAAAEEMGTTESAQGESAADENASAAVTVVNTEETEAAPAEESVQETSAPAESESSTEEAAPEPAETSQTGDPSVVVIPEESRTEETEPVVIPEEALSEESAEEITTDEETIVYPWDEDENFSSTVDGGLLSTMSSSLRPKAVIARKVYKLRSAIDQDYVLDVKSAGTANATIIHLYKDNGTDAQKFFLQENSDGTVTFVSYMSGKVIDIKANSSKNGAQVQIYQSNDTSAQKFKMVENSDGTVTLKHSENGKAIDISGAVATNGRKVQLYTSNGTKAQKFYLDEETEYVYDYSDNEWLIRSRLNSASVLNVASSSTANAGNINLYATTKNANQRFTIEPVGGYYKITNVNSGKVIDVKSAKSANGTNIQQYTWNTTGAQLWKIQVNDDGSVTFVSAVNNSKVIDLKSAKTANGTNAQLYTSNGTDAQKFFLVNADLDWNASYTAGTGKKVSTDAYNQDVLVNIIGAVESGGQVYGKRNYGAYADPYAVSSIEYTITIGWPQFYGGEAKTLIKKIKSKFDAFDKENGNKKSTFHEMYDQDGKLEAMLDKDWVALKWNPANTSVTNKNTNVKTLKDVIKQLIVTPYGQEAQDEQFLEQMSSHIAFCEKNYTTDVKAVLMYCEIRHLGGANPAKRIFDRLNGCYSVDSIMASLALDRLDAKSNNQVGDDKYWSRHEKCKEFVQKYAKP